LRAAGWLKVTVFLMTFCLIFAGWALSAEVIDDVGRLITIPGKPHRIVSLAPNITEILFAVGAGDQVIGVTDFCDFPPEAAEKARIGGFVNPSVEIITSLNPDLIIGTADGNRPGDVLMLEKIGLAAFVIDTRSIDDIYRSIKTIGELTGHAEAAAELVAFMTGRREEIKVSVSVREKPRVLFIVGQKPLVAVGPGTFIHQVIEAAGGLNAMGGSPVRYPLLGAENLLSLNPDVIVTAVSENGPPETPQPEPPGWEGLQAVIQGRVHHLTDDTVLRPGPRIMDALALLAVIFHPGILERGP
jgi:iron complex transport system substrate-binding protein